MMDWGIMFPWLAAVAEKYLLKRMQKSLNLALSQHKIYKTKSMHDINVFRQIYGEFETQFLCPVCLEHPPM